MDGFMKCSIPSCPDEYFQTITRAGWVRRYLALKRRRAGAVRMTAYRLCDDGASFLTQIMCNKRTMTCKRGASGLLRTISALDGACVRFPGLHQGYL